MNDFNIEQMLQYTFFSYQNKEPFIKCEFTSCKIDKIINSIVFFSGDYFYPHCKMIISLNNTTPKLIISSPNLDIVEFMLNDNKFKIYCHK